MRFLLSLALIALAIATPANAQNMKTILDLPDGATLITLSANERVEIQQDLLIANLRYQIEDTNPRTVQDSINKKMKDALKEAQKISTVKAATTQYNIYEYDPNRNKQLKDAKKVWRGQQGLMIKGKKPDDLLELVGKLQDIGLTMNGLQYTVSPELLEETRDGLLENALTKLTKKAQRTAKALGKTSAELKTVNVNNGGGYHRQAPMARGMAAMSMDTKMAAPVAAPGESQVTLNVSAQALLK